MVWRFFPPALLALLAPVVCGTSLGPVPGSTSSGNASTPSTSISFNYGLDNASLVNVSLGMNYPAVLLETAAVTAVVCSPTSVAVTFNSTAAFSAAAATWNGTVVLVTNHLGDCDTELERGFFVANSFSVDASSLTITADAEKTDIASVAASTEITFSNVPATTTAKREIVINDTLVSISAALSLPSPVTLFSDAPYATLEVQSGDVSVDLTVSGYLRYTILWGTLDAFYIDIDADLSASLTLQAAAEDSWSGNYSYAPAALAFSAIDVPGIITLGPSLGFAVGAVLDAAAAVNVTGTVGASFPNGAVHIDFVDSAHSYTSGWTPTLQSELDVTEQVVVSLDPYVNVTLELALDVLDGLLDLSGGIVAAPQFNNQFVLTGSQQTGTGVGGATQGGSCADGVEIASEFEFGVVAFVTDSWGDSWSDTLYSVTVPIADECYSF